MKSSFSLSPSTFLILLLPFWYVTQLRLSSLVCAIGQACTHTDTLWHTHWGRPWSKKKKKPSFRQQQQQQQRQSLFSFLLPVLFFLLSPLRNNNHTSTSLPPTQPPTTTAAAAARTSFSRLNGPLFPYPCRVGSCTTTRRHKRQCDCLLNAHSSIDYNRIAGGRSPPLMNRYLHDNPLVRTTIETQSMPLGWGKDLKGYLTILNANGPQWPCPRWRPPKMRARAL